MGPKKNLSKKAEKRKEKEENSRRASFLLFSKYYLGQYERERWESLVTALRRPVRYCALINKFSNQEFRENLIGITGTRETIQLLEDYSYGYVKIGLIRGDEGEEGEKQNDDEENSNSEEKEEKNEMKGNLKIDEDGECLFDVLDDEILAHRWPAPGIPSSLDPNGLCCYYPMDGASLLPVLALNLTPDSRVFDMCAAPGGKSLAITSYLTETGDGSLTCCDISPGRRLRLLNTLRRYLPPSIHAHVNVLSGDATSPSFYSDHGLYDQFDRILVDAPCSSERHVLHSLEELSKWSAGRSKNNSERQFLLLTNALKICSVPGRVVYSTCSLSTLENDDVVRKVVHKINKKIAEGSTESNESTQQVPRIPHVEICRINPLNMPFGEPTELGWHILPDRSDGWGPIYFSVLDVAYRAERRSEEK